jgi:DNA-directed RNA polymerase-3 subunit RPC5
METLPAGLTLSQGAALEFDDSDYDSDPDDPVIASYDIYLKPQIANGRRVYILQFPNRDQNEPYSAANSCEPTELRIKPESGMVEFDIPIDFENNFDKTKGLKWGGAMSRSEHLKGAGMHGLPAGFGIGSVQSKGKPLTVDDEEKVVREALGDFDSAVQKGQVLTKQTLGGQIPQIEQHSPQYMIGTFREGKWLQTITLSKCSHSLRSTPSYSCRCNSSNATPVSPS